MPPAAGSLAGCGRPTACGAAWRHVASRAGRGRRSRPAPSSDRPVRGRLHGRATVGDGERIGLAASTFGSGVTCSASAAPAGESADRPANGSVVGAFLFLFNPSGANIWLGLAGVAADALRFRSRSRRAFFGVSPMYSGLYCTPRASAWEISESAAARSFSAMACRARRSRSAVCCRLSSDGLSAGADCPTAAAPSHACDVQHDGSSRRDSRRKNDRRLRSSRQVLLRSFSTELSL